MQDAIFMAAHDEVGDLDDDGYDLRQRTLELFGTPKLTGANQ